MLGLIIVLIIIWDIIRMIIFSDEIEFIEIVINCIVITIIVYALLVGWSIL